MSVTPIVHIKNSILRLDVGPSLDCMSSVLENLKLFQVLVKTQTYLKQRNIYISKDHRKNAHTYPALDGHDVLANKPEMCFLLKCT